jgi:hypothetical protein
MPVLHMQTDGVRSAGQYLGQVASNLDQQSQQLTNAIHVLSNNWQGPSYDSFVGDIVLTVNAETLYGQDLGGINNKHSVVVAGMVKDENDTVTKYLVLDPNLGLDETLGKGYYEVDVAQLEQAWAEEGKKGIATRLGW